MIGERIGIFLNKKGISGYRAAKDTGISAQVISAYLTGKRDPSGDMLSKILLTYPELNADWLLTGLGEMLLKSAVAV